MEAILNSVSDPSDLMNISDANVPYRFDQIFSAQGFGAKRLERNRLKLMKEIDPHVQGLLVDGEKVRFVSWGVEYSFVEQYFMGVWAHLINRRALVFTDRRILILQISSRRKVLDLKAQIRFEAIEGFANRTFGYIGLVLRNKKNVYITGMPRKDRKAVKALISEKLLVKSVNAMALGVENLCPNCGNKVVGFPDRCNHCAKAFKSARKAGWLSLVFPGLGDLYLGHRALGTIEIIGGLIAWFGLALPFSVAAVTKNGEWMVPAIVAGGVFVFVHGVDCLITRRVGFKGIYPGQ